MLVPADRIGEHGLDTGLDRLLFGKLEHAVRWFHASIDEVTARPSDRRADTLAASR